VFSGTRALYPRRRAHGHLTQGTLCRVRWRISLTPELTVSAVREGEPHKRLAYIGPTHSYDFDGLLTQLLADGRLLATLSDDARSPVRFECVGLFDESTPSFVLSRVLIGQLVSLGAAVRLSVSRYAAARGHSGVPEIPETRVEFNLQSTTQSEPDEISQLLGLTPTATIRVGQIQPIVKLPSPRTAWQLKSKTLRAWNFDPLVHEVLTTLQARADVVASLTRHRFDGILSLVASFSDRSPEVNLTAGDLRLIRTLGLEVDVDLTA